MHNYYIDMVLDYDKDVNSQDNDQHLFRQLYIYKIVQKRSWLFCYEPRFWRHVNRAYRVYLVCKNTIREGVVNGFSLRFQRRFSRHIEFPSVQGRWCSISRPSISVVGIGWDFLYRLKSFLLKQNTSAVNWKIEENGLSWSSISEEQRHNVRRHS